MTDSFADIERRIAAIEERNRRVEAEKAWEVSLFRLVSIASMTYLTAFLVLFSMNAAKPFLSALIPAVGFMLSVQTLPTIRRRWIQSRSSS